MRSLACLLVHDRAKETIDIPMFDGFKNFLALEAESEFGIRFGAGNAVSKDNVDYYLVELTGQRVKEMLLNDLADHLEAKYLEACQNGIEPTC